MVRSQAVKIEKNKGETVRKRLKELGMLKTHLLPKKNDENIFLPIHDGKKIGYQIVEMDFEEKKRKPRSYKDVLNLPPELQQLLPTSYDVIGDIALIKIPDEILGYTKEIGNAILRVHKNIKVVCLSKPVTGEYRTREVEVIAGEKRTTTLHREYGVELHLDVEKTFFSPRLAGERHRVAGLVKKNENVVDMFTGVAPFAIMIAKQGSPKIVYAIDKNPAAIKFAKKNVTHNRVVDKVEVIQGDAREVMKNFVQKNLKADRIIMNHPFFTQNFLNDALLIAKKGCVIHYYDILNEDEVDNRVEFFKKVSKNAEMEVKSVRMIKTYAPREFYTCFDITVTHMPA
ncbi:MAG TPA: class I SAM-dependent methyltransferase family protein [Thermoplasmatales archaeon]|nr:class I SAM-dependent methyltransferase family protein [Thermoplasmatales archaeon]